MSHFRKVFNYLNKILYFPYRQEAPKESSSVSDNIVINMLFIILLLVGFAMLWNKFQDSEFKPIVEMEPNRWSILIADSDESCWGKNKEMECPSSPLVTNLWNSSIKRRSNEYFKLLDTNLKQFFWMGLKIKPYELKRAASFGATRLMLGLLYSRYEVWIDGNRVQTGNYLENDMPIAIDLTMERMQSEEPLYVAIGVYRDGKMLTIDSDWFVPAMGFYTSRVSDQQIRWIAFSRDARFYILFSIFLLFGLIFRSAAYTKKGNVEYPAAAIFSFVIGFFQFVSADSSFRFLGPDLYYAFLNSIIFAEFFAVLGLGLAISRGRNTLLKLVTFLVPISFIAIFIYTVSIHDNGNFTEKSLNYLTPLGYLISGVLCSFQYLYIKINYGNNDKTVKRLVLLSSMSLIFLFIAIGFIIESMQTQAVESHWIRLVTIVPLFLLITSIAETVRQSYKIIESTSISSYHQQNPLPDSISGLVLNLDLKGSEKLFRAGARHEVGGTLVNAVISQVWGQFVSFGATIMQSSGDDLLILFPDSLLQEDSSIWIKALYRVHEELRIIARQLADSQPELSTIKGIEFRASIMRGSVRPIWRTIGSSRIPTWVEASDKNVFVDTARLLELEKTLKNDVINKTDEQFNSVLIANRDMESELKEIEGLSYFPVQGEGKHGQIYQGFLIIINSQAFDFKYAV